MTTYAQMFIEIGIDACILGIGVCGAIFANPEVDKRLGPNGFPLAVFMLFVTLGLTGFCRHQRDWTRINETQRARLSILTGTLILGINTAIIWRPHDDKGYYLDH